MKHTLAKQLAQKYNIEPNTSALMEFSLLSERTARKNILSLLRQNKKNIQSLNKECKKLREEKKETFCGRGY